MKPDSVIIPCSNCGTKNRVPAARLEDRPKCGKCGAHLSLDPLGRPVNVSDADFHREVMASPLPVLVDCWAPWCGPCRAVAPVLDVLARNYKGRIKIAKLNLDENPVTGSRFSITSVPTLLLVKDGRIVDTLVGALPREHMEAAIERIL